MQLFQLIHHITMKTSSSSRTLILPPALRGNAPSQLADTRQITIVGAPGAGKSRFMKELERLNGTRVFCISAASAPYPQRRESDRPGSVDMLYRDAMQRLPYLKGDAVSELDKLVFLLVADEIESLMRGKQSHTPSEPTRTDALISIWQRIFPDNRIVLDRGMMLFATGAGTDLIPAASLSQSEQAVLYYCAAVLFAMPDATIFVDSPSLFLHPATTARCWDLLEELRPDCSFVYDSVDVEFVNSRSRNTCIWVKRYDAAAACWDYEVIREEEAQEEMFVDLLGSRRPILFIEGDRLHSIDARLYPLVFPDHDVRPLGSCDKVIETVRAFGGQTRLHHLVSRGIVDRDRRTDKEVEYLRRKGVMVPDVAEVENIFLIEGVIRAMARMRGINPDEAFARVSKGVRREFAAQCQEQALQHVRHRIKREVETKVDARFSCITAMELHLNALPAKLHPRKQYDELLRTFRGYLARKDYAAIIRVFNHKPMLTSSGVAQALGFNNKGEYIAALLATLKTDTPHAAAIRTAIRASFRF